MPIVLHTLYNSTNLQTEQKKTPSSTGKTHRRLAEGLVGEKAVASYGKKQKLGHTTEYGIWYPESYPAPHSVGENFISIINYLFPIKI